MRCSFLVVVGAMAISGGMLTGCGTTSKVVSRAYHVLPFTGKPAPTPPGTASKRTQNLVLKMQLSPVPLKLSDTRQLDVRLRLENVSGKFVQLEFPTTQRVEILVRDSSGKLVTQWSEAHTFESVPGYVGINPGEHVEYATTVSARDMQPGKTYTVTGFFPNFEKLTTEEIVTPQP